MLLARDVTNSNASKYAMPVHEREGILAVDSEAPGQHSPSVPGICEYTCQQCSTLTVDALTASPRRHRQQP
jgi:hypothetical protein